MKVITEYQREFQRYFGAGSDASAAAELKRTNPAKYAELRTQWLQAEKIPPTPLQAAKARLDAQGREREYSPEELAARREFSPEQVKAILNKPANQPGESLGDIKKADPARFHRLQVAARSYGLVNESMVIVRNNHPKTQPQAAPADDRTFLTISDSLADKFHLEHGTKVPADKLSEMIAVASQVKSAKDSQ